MAAFATPDIVKDAIVVAAFVTLGLVRTDRRLAGAHKQAVELERERLHGMFWEAGIPVDRSDTMVVFVALLCHRRLAEGAGRMRVRGSLDYIDPQRVWDEALERYGRPLFDFAMANFGKTLLGPDSCLLIARKNKARRFVWTLGAATALLVLLDYWLMR